MVNPLSIKQKGKNKYTLKSTYLFTASSIKALIKIILGTYPGKKASLNVLLKYVPEVTCFHLNEILM